MEYREALEATRDHALSCRRDNAAVRNICPQKPGTVLRISIPPGTEINLLNLIELSSPGGICIIVRLPFLGKGCGLSHKDLAGIFDSIKLAGGSVEVL